MKILKLIMVVIVSLIILHYVNGYEMLEDDINIIITPTTVNTNHINFNFNGDGESYFTVILMSNYAITDCEISAFYECSISDGERIQVSRDFSNVNAFLYLSDNIDVRVTDQLGNNATANIKVNYLNFASFIKTQEVEVNDLFQSLPFIFRVKENKLIGIHMFPILIFVLFIWWRLKK